MKHLKILKMITTLLIALFSAPAMSAPISYVKESPVSLYNIATGYLPYIDNDEGDDAWIYAKYVYDLRNQTGSAVWYPFSLGNGTYTFKNAKYNYCIKRYNNGIVQKACNHVDPYQQWYLQFLSNGAFLVKLVVSEHNSDPNLCLYTSNNNLYVGACNQSDANHHWALIPPLSPSYELADIPPM